jgi:hypothetical protein
MVRKLGVALAAMAMLILFSVTALADNIPGGYLTLPRP